MPHPEQLLFGAQYGSQPAADGEYTVGPNLPADPLAGTDLEAGDSLGRIVGGETDAIDPTIPPADGLVTIATSSFTDIYGTTGRADAVFRALPSGRGVFDAGTFLWGWALDRYSSNTERNQ